VLISSYAAAFDKGDLCGCSERFSLTKKALSNAFESRSFPSGVMFHSDQGCHYAHWPDMDEKKVINRGKEELGRKAK